MSDTNFLHTIKPIQKKNASAKLFQLTSLSCALALAGCGGGGDGGTVDAIAPKPDLGTTNGGSGGSNSSGNGGTTQPTKEPAFYIQKLTPSLENIKLTEKQETQEITVVVKALQKKTAGAMVGKEVTLAVADSEKLGISITGNSTQTTGADGNATYKIVFNPKAVTDEELLLKGINLTATAKAQDGSVVEQVTKIGVSKEGSIGSVVESKLQLSSSLVSATLLSDEEINARGDTVTISVQAKQTNGVAAEGVDVTLGINDVKGVSIIGGGKKQTNSSGEAQFTLVVDSTLSDTERNNLIKNGISYSIKLIEEDGAEKPDTGKWTVTNPSSNYDVSIINNTQPLSAYGDQKTLTIKATPHTDKALPIKGSIVKVALNDTAKLPKGVSLSRDLVELNDQGQATLDLVIPKGLSTKEKKYLEKNGVSYTLNLVEPNHADTSITVKSEVYIPEAQYKVSVDSVNKKALSSAGGSTQISFRVNNKTNGEPVVGQKVVASLSEKVKATGLVTLDNAAEQTTDNQGIVTYTVRIPTGLTVQQRKELVELEQFALGVSITEPTGATTPSASQLIAINASDVDSAITVTSSASKEIVNVQGDTFTIAVSAVQKGGAAAIGELVKLQLEEIDGVRITGGNTQQTNEQGIATFALRVDSGLTQTKRQQLIQSGIQYTAVLTASDGTQYKLGTQTIKAAEKNANIIIESVLPVSELGGNSNIVVKVVEGASANPVVGKEVNIELTNAARQVGISLASSTATTDRDGKAIFVVSIPEGLSPAARKELKDNGIEYRVSYENNGIIAEPQDGQVTVTPVTVDFRNLDSSAQYEINNTGGSQAIEFQLFRKDTDGNKIPVSNQAVNFVFNKPNIAKLLTINGVRGSSVVTANTNDNGIVSFDVLVPSNLTTEQRETLNNANLVATLTETLTGKTQSATVNVKAIKSEIELDAEAVNNLNLNGGETQIRVVAKKKNDEGRYDSVSGQSVTIALPSRLAQAGLMLSSSPTQTTDNSGVATFTIAAPSGLSNQQKDDIGRTFSIGVATKDANGNTETQTTTVTTVRPTSTQEKLTLGANKVVNTNGDTFKVFARITDEDGVGVANAPVHLAVKEPIKTGVRITGSNTVTTNGDGIAEFNLTLESGSNVSQAILEQGIGIKAIATSSDGVALEQDYVVGVDSTTIDSYVIMTSADKTTLNTGGDQTNVTFRIVDSQGGVLAGVPVKLSIDEPELSGAALTTTSVVQSDAQGLVEAGVVLGVNSVNSRLNHDVVVTAKVVTPEYDSNGQVSMQARAKESITLQAIGTTIEIQASKTNLQTDAEVTLTATVIDAAKNPVPAADVQWIDKNGQPISTNARSQTDKQGVATIDVNEKDLAFDANGNLQVFAKVSGKENYVTQRSKNSIALVQTSQAGISFNDLRGLYDVNTEQTINVQIRSDNAASLVGEMVEVQTTLGKFANGQVITTQPITSEMVTGNVITVPVKLKSSLAGTAVLTASVLGQTNAAGEQLSTTVDTRFKATIPAKMLLQATKSVITPGGNTEIIAIVKDENDVPVEGVTVVFSRSRDSSTGRLSAATAVTNAQGEAIVVYRANTDSPINGVVINAEILNGTRYGIGQKQISITVSDRAVYMTLGFSDKLQVSPDNIYYIKQASIAVMDGSGRPVANKPVSLKSYATAYREGLVCLAEHNISYQPENTVDADGKVVVPDLQENTRKFAAVFSSNWIDTEDSQLNYILDSNEDLNNSQKLEAINPVTILGGTLDNDEYTFITDDEGKVDFRIRYPKIYANWTQIRFDATTQLNGSENQQSFNVQLPVLEDDMVISDDQIITPYLNDASPFGIGDQVCINNLTISVNANTNMSVVAGGVSGLDKTLTSRIFINNIARGQMQVTPAMPGFFYSFNTAFDKGTLVSVVVGSSRATEVIKTK